MVKIKEYFVRLNVLFCIQKNVIFICLPCLATRITSTVSCIFPYICPMIIMCCAYMDVALFYFIARMFVKLCFE